MEDIKKLTSRMGIKAKSAGPWDGVSKEHLGKHRDGVGKCGCYDVELDENGYCRDEDCRYRRIVKAFHDGEAMRLKDGTIVWTPGVKIREG